MVGNRHQHILLIILHLPGQGSFVYQVSMELAEIFGDMYVGGGKEKRGSKIYS